jgi:hypothetical protein
VALQNAVSGAETPRTSDAVPLRQRSVARTQQQQISNSNRRRSGAAQNLDIEKERENDDGFFSFIVFLVFFTLVAL